VKREHRLWEVVVFLEEFVHPFLYGIQAVQFLWVSWGVSHLL
jgi:hypothetical protein